jgi:superfamily II DNA helicase RecQ
MQMIFQLDVPHALYSGKNVMSVAATGAGKTLSFFTALLMACAEGKQKLVIVVTPLNILGLQTQELLEKAKIQAIALNSKTATGVAYNVRCNMHILSVCV